MYKFLLLIREDLGRLEQMTEKELQDDILQMTRWVEELTQNENFVQGEPLLNYGRYVAKDSILTDGPFIETKEAISGYLIIAARDLDQAAAITQTCPHVNSGSVVIEVRPIMRLA